MRIVVGEKAELGMGNIESHDQEAESKTFQLVIFQVG